MEKIATFQERLAYILNLRRMRPIDLAHESGIEKSRIYYYLRGRNGPKHPAAETMAKVLDVDINWLLGFDVPMTLARKDTFAEKFSRLNEIGKEKAEEYVDDLLENYKYCSPIISKKMA